ncbi:ABC transporter ATP-binding protein [Candidatus Uabimicrobium amorphum]|uniref:ABC transporter ATP-binding protein n=1 Tax=Uabimicrobium amorphum TaxID=2596890 RepID=A0A5S9F4K1_UABAM|nr:ABC transporter ATP-binding protein [Candidatus Uabimicrobium amorphum]BBM85866.1 ABC transporter ATP-binding protein [Candidatus Uabimicrobium amorphum]
MNAKEELPANTRKKTPNMLRTFLRLLVYVKPHKGLVIISVLLSILISMTHVASLAVFKPIGDCLFQGDKSIVTQISAWGELGEFVVAVFGEDFLNNRYNILYISMSFLTAMIVLKNIFRFSHDYVSNYIGNKTLIRVREDTFRKIIQAKMEFFAKSDSASTINVLHKQIRSLRGGLSLFFGKVQREPLKIIVSLVICFAVNWLLAVILFAVIPCFLGILYFLRRSFRKKLKENLRQDSNVLRVIQDAFHGIDSVKNHTVEEFFCRKLHEEEQLNFQKRMQFVTLRSATSPITEVLISIIGVFVLVLSARMVLERQMTSGDFFVFYAAVVVIVDPLRKLSKSYSEMLTCTTIAQKIFKLQDRAVENTEQQMNSLAFSFKDTIEFRDVGFAYDKNSLVLHNVSFCVKKGEKVGIFGCNGSGKSTLCKLLLKLYSPQQGKILMDGVCLQEYDTIDLRKNISVIGQKPYMFHLSIMDNLCLGNDYEKDRVMEILQETESLDFVLDSENELASLYHKQAKFSGGQEQRLFISRAMLKDCDLFIFDEFTAALDQKIEMHIQEYMQKNYPEKTMITISHRTSTLNYVDKLIVFENGQIECCGEKNKVLQESRVLKELLQSNVDS